MPLLLACQRLLALDALLHRRHPPVEVSLRVLEPAVAPDAYRLAVPLVHHVAQVPVQAGVEGGGAQG